MLADRIEIAGREGLLEEGELLTELRRLPVGQPGAG